MIQWLHQAYRKFLVLRQSRTVKQQYKCNRLKILLVCQLKWLTHENRHIRVRRYAPWDLYLDSQCLFLLAHHLHVRHLHDYLGVPDWRLVLIKF